MSKIEIINRALLKLGEPPVASLNDAAFGKSYELIYEDVKNLLLSSYPWRFAVTTKRLARLEEKYGDSETGSFSELLTMSIEATKSFEDGELMATATLPADVKDFVTAAVTSNTSNSGEIRVTLGYLAR